MRRYLVVANQTLQAAELGGELRNKISAGPCSFFVLVPDTKAAQYDAVAAGGVLRQPGMWWWASAASSSVPRCQSAASSARPTSPHWPSTS